jgi:hypothetical protein
VIKLSIFRLKELLDRPDLIQTVPNLFIGSTDLIDDIGRNLPFRSNPLALLLEFPKVPLQIVIMALNRFI